MEKQEFQSKTQLFLLRMHAVVDKVMKVLLFPFRKLGLVKDTE